MSVPRRILYKTRSFVLHTRAFSSLTKSITVRPSLRAYNELAVISPGKFKIPKKPFDMTVEYIDSSPNEKKKRTVVALHGTPGNCHHFEKMAEHFHTSNDDVRFISLSFPNFSHTRENGYFWHTTPEKTNFLRQFLYDMKIDTIDSFVIHSFGIHPVLVLWENPEEFKIKSVCMYAPQPFWEKGYQQYLDRSRKLYTFHNSVWYKFLEMNKLHEKFSTALKFTDTNEVLLFCSLLFDDMRHGFEDRLRRAIKNTDIPVSLMYGTKEKLVSKESIAKFNTILGMRDDQISRLDTKIHTDKDVIDSGRRVNSFILDNAGHMLHINHHRMAMKALMNLLAKVDN